MGKVLCGLVLLIGLMSFAHDHTPLGDFNPVSTLKSSVTAPVESANKTATHAQCAAITLSTGDASDCAVLLTPDELSAYEAANG
jgi:hypothetical protein